MMRDLIIIGGGEHGHCVYEAAQLSGMSAIGFVDREERSIKPYLGTDAALAHYPNADFILGVGLGNVRTARAEIVSRCPDRWVSVIHPTAIISPSARIGKGTVILAGAIVNANAVIGEHCIINTGAVVEHDCEIGDFTHLCPRVVMGGGTRIGSNSFIGMGAVLRDHIELPPREFIMMGAVIRSNKIASSMSARAMLVPSDDVMEERALAFYNTGKEFAR
jgi:acetyltransferase EpsM